MTTKTIATAFFKPQKALLALFIPGLFLMGLGLAAYAAPNLLAYFLAFFSIFFGTFFLLLGYKVFRFMRRLSDMQRQMQASVSIHGNMDEAFKGSGFASDFFSSSFMRELGFGKNDNGTIQGRDNVEDGLLRLKKRGSKTIDLTEIIETGPHEKKIIFH